jgi:hypothetical protein
MPSRISAPPPAALLPAHEERRSEAHARR